MIRSARLPPTRHFNKQIWKITLKQLHICFDRLLAEVGMGRQLMVYREGLLVFTLKPVSKTERHMVVQPARRTRLSRKAGKKW